jgi:zinc protease
MIHPTFRSVRRALFLICVLSVAGSAASAPPPSQTDAHGVLRATLSNGLRVVIVRNRLAPVVATAVNYLVGSDESPKGFPGTAHAQEHMMFRGSPGLTTDQLAAIGAVMGGNFNANTRESVTQYLFTVPADDLDVALHVEATRMAGANDLDKDWNDERGAIEQEVASDLSNPFYVMYEKLRTIMFKGTPYEHDALGTRPSFDKTPASMLKGLYDKWYAPNNAILVIVGDVDPDKTLVGVKNLFGAIPAKKLPPRPAFKFTPLKPTSINLDTDRPSATEVIAFRTGGLDSADFPALEVLGDVLSSHRFDLYGMVPEGKALDAEFDLDPLPRSGLAYAAVSFPADGDPKAVEAEMRKILANVAKKGVPAELVDAAKLSETRETEFQKNSIADLASTWSDAIALYGLRSPEDDLVRIKKVTVADVNRVARKYLDLAHAVTVTLVPRASGQPVASGGGYGGQESIALGEAKPTPLPDWANTALARLEVPKSTVSPTVSVLPNGLTLIVQPEDVSDSVTVYGHVRNRAETEEPVGKEGVNYALSRLFSYGTTTLDRIAFQSALDEIGANEDAGTDFYVQVLSDHFDTGVKLLADNELHPALPQQAMDVIRPQLAAVVATRNKSPGYLAQKSLRGQLYPKGDPVLREATPESLNSLTLDDVRAYHHAVLRPDMTSIIVIGNITPEAARATIEKYFGGWVADGAKPDVDLPDAPPNAAGTAAVPDASRVQDSVSVAQNLGVKRSDPDYYALEMGSAVLGGGFYSTRLSVELRKKAGLVYSVGSDLTVGRTRGVYAVQYACDPQNVTKAANIVVRELKDMQAAPVSDEELNRAKALKLRQIPLGASSVNDIARLLATYWDLKLPLDESTQAAQHYVAMTPADVQKAFVKWIRPDSLVRITQGPPPQ